MCLIILCDTVAFDSFIVTSFLPSSNEMSVGSNVLLLDMGMNILSVPQHRTMLHCYLFKGEGSIGVCPALPVEMWR